MDDKKRLTATQAKQHAWMTSNDINDIDILDTVRENFNPRRTLKSAVSAVRAMNRLKTATATEKKEGVATSAFAKAIEAAKLKKQQEDAAAAAAAQNEQPAAAVPVAAV